MNRHSELLHAPFGQGDCVVAGVSGGADSMAMLHMLLQDVRGLLVHVCHLEHGLRGSEGRQDAQFVHEFCTSTSISFTMHRCDIASLAEQNKMTVEECGREERYSFFTRTAEALQHKTGRKTWIATAHTCSDQAETILFRMARGASLHGLCGIPYRRGRIVRPILHLTRQQIEDYCSQYGLAYVTDSTNADPSYARNRIRRYVVPQLKEINTAFERKMGQAANSLAVDDDYLEQCGKKLFKQCCPDGGRLDLTLLSDVHEAVKRRVLRLYLEQRKVPVSNQSLERLSALCINGGKWNAAGNLFFYGDKAHLWTETDEKEEIFYEYPLPEKYFHSKTGKLYKVQTLETNTSALFHKVYKNLFDISIDCGKIFGSVTVHSRKGGERVKLHDQKHTKPLKKLYQEFNVPISERRRRFLLWDEKGVIAVEGLGVANRVMCDEETTKRIEIKPVKGKRDDERGYPEGFADRGGTPRQSKGTGNPDCK